MFPPSSGINLSLSALSGVSGSISIACWVVVFSPQIIENFRRRSADGLSITFIIIWLAGDVFNILGSVLQGVLPTMLILAVYYTLADIVLLGQCWYYRGFSLWDSPDSTDTNQADDAERAPLLNSSSNGHVQRNGSANASLGVPTTTNPDNTHHRRSSSFSEAIRRDLAQADGANLSPATPLLSNSNAKPKTSAPPPKKFTPLQSALFNIFAVFLVCAAGALGWYVSSSSSSSSSNHSDSPPEPPHFDTLGQIFGYLCAVLYLGSRVPQLLLNHRRKSTEGVSLLFFLFACIGNLTYDMSIFAYDPTPLCRGGSGNGGDRLCAPGEAGAIYARYIAVNASWIAGSLGTLMLDMAIFAQFFWYKKSGSGDSDGGGNDDGVAVE